MSIFSTNKVEIGLAQRNRVLFGADWSAAALHSSPPSIICLSCPTHTTVTQVIHSSLRGFETEETSHGLGQLFVYSGELKVFKRLAECYFGLILQILW